MKNTILIEKASEYLKMLCIEIPTRQVGSQGNRDATDFFKRCSSSFGFQTDQLEFDCIDWTTEGVRLEVKGQRFEAFSSPYSLGCRVSAPLVGITSLDELKSC